jgi:hypothetical protein
LPNVFPKQFQIKQRILFASTAIATATTVPYGLVYFPHGEGDAKCNYAKYG